MHRPDAREPIIPEEAVKDSWGVEASHDESTNIGDEAGLSAHRKDASTGRSSRRRGGGTTGTDGRESAGGGFLEWQLYIHKGGYGLDRTAVLGVLKKVALAGLKLGIPVEDVELGILKRLDDNISMATDRERWVKPIRLIKHSKQPPENRVSD